MEENTIKDENVVKDENAISDENVQNEASTLNDDPLEAVSGGLPGVADAPVAKHPPI